MEIYKISDMDNEAYISEIDKVYALTNDKSRVPGTTPYNCLNEVFIVRKDGSYDHFMADPNDIDVRGEETVDFLRFIANFSAYKGYSVEEMANTPYFNQLRLGTRDRDTQVFIKNLRKNYKKYVNQSRDDYGSQKKPWSAKKKAVAGGIGALGVMAAVGSAGTIAYNRFNNNNASNLETQVDADDTQEFDLNLEGKDFAYYENDANIPASLQKDYALKSSDSLYNFLSSFNSTSTVDGQTYKTGYTYRQLLYADIFFNGNYYSNDELLTILANFDIMEDQYDENGELKISFKNEIDGFLYSTVATAMDTPSKLTQVFDLIKDDEAKAKALESVPLMENLMTAIKNDGNVKEAKEAYEKWLTDSFLEDNTNSTTGERRYNAVDLSANQALQFVVNAEIAAINLTSNTINDDIAEILVSGQNGNQSMTNSANEALFGRLENFNAYREQMINEDQSTDDLNEYKALLLADKSEKEKQKMMEQNPGISLTAEESDYDQLTEKTCDVDQIIRIMSEQLKTLGKEPTRDEQDDYLGAIITYYLEKQMADTSSYSTGSGSSGQRTSNSQTVIDDTKGTPQEKRNQAVVASSELLVDQAELAENIREDILGSVVTPEDEAETTKKAQENANEQAKLDTAAWYKIYNEAYAWYSVYGEKNGEAPAASLYANSNKKIGDSTGWKETTESYAWYQGKQAGLAAYYKDHKEEAITGGDSQVDEDLKEDNIDIDDIGTDKGDSNGQTIDDIINAGNSEDPNKDNTIPGGGSDSGITPPPPEDLNGGSDNNNGNDNTNTEEPSLPENGNEGTIDPPGGDGPPDGWHGFEDDDITDGLPQNPDGSYGGGTEIDDSVEDVLNGSESSSAPSEIPSEAPSEIFSEAPSEAPANEVIESTPETSVASTVDQAIDAIVEETAQQIYEEQTMGGDAIIYEGLEDYVPVGTEESITPEETETVKTMK